MSDTREPSDHGIVVEGKDSGVRYASLEANFDEKNERYVRDLLPGETVFGYRPKRKDEREDASEAQEGTSSPEQPTNSLSGDSEGVSKPSATAKTTK